MTDKFLTILISLIVVFVLIEAFIPGINRNSVVNMIKLNQEIGISTRKNIEIHETLVLSFDSHRTVINYNDSRAFSSGDSIVYQLTPLLKNLKKVTHKQSGYEITAHSYSMLVTLLVVAVIGQVISINVNMDKSRKELVQIIIFSLLFVIGYIFLFK